MSIHDSPRGREIVEGGILDGRLIARVVSCKTGHILVQTDPLGDYVFDPGERVALTYIPPPFREIEGEDGTRLRFHQADKDGVMSISLLDAHNRAGPGWSKFRKDDVIQALRDLRLLDAKKE